MVVVAQLLPNEINGLKRSPQRAFYFSELNVGLEYQETQYYAAVDFFGGHEALEKTIEREKAKRNKCRVHNCHLIIVHEGYDFEVVKKQIEKTLKNDAQ